MTTYAYNHKDKQIAVDSQGTASSVYYGDVDKIHKYGDRIFILGGLVCDQDYFIENFERYKKIDVDVELECEGFMVEKGICYLVFATDGIFNMEKLTQNKCGGSGSRFALAAMDFGCNAQEAVEYAMTRDIYTGGKVHVIEVKVDE